LIQEEIKRRLNSGNTCYRSVQNLLSSRLLSKNVKIRMYKTITLPLVLYGCETWSLKLREKHRLMVFILGFCILLHVLYQGYQNKTVLRNNCSRLLLYFYTSTAICFGLHWPSSRGTHSIICKEVIFFTTDPLSVVQIVFVHVI
jgi:hypothetical protein